MSYLYNSGFLVTPVAQRSCHLGSVAHSDPGGHLPSWVTNKLSSILAPKMVKKLHKACINYASWKVQQITPRMEIIKTVSILIFLIIISNFLSTKTTIILMKEDYICRDYTIQAINRGCIQNRFQQREFILQIVSSKFPNLVQN